ncbi:hypothetical protein ACFWIY_03950 [Streptomyces sioyaensis]|uniref:hypothetical protein n=1 Tax=Streptomyces sioyaensis TaxID=67364 RepID=UPI00364A354B
MAERMEPHVICPNGHVVKLAAFCSVCGAPISTGRSTADDQRRRWAIVITGLLLVAAIVGVGAYIGVTQLTGPSTRNPASAPSTISPPSPTGPPPDTSRPQSTTPNSTPPPPVNASRKAVVEAYFAAINSGNYQHAWDLGGKNIQPGSYSSFVQSFNDTASDDVTVVSVTGDSVQIVLDATQTDGTHKSFAGAYTVRDGTIVSAHIRETTGQD